VWLRGPGGEFELPFDEAVFGGPARRESRNYWIMRERAEDVLIPNVTRFGEKNKATGTQGYENLPSETALEGLLLPAPPGKEYRLLKVLTQPASADQVARLGNDRAPVFRPMSAKSGASAPPDLPEREREARSLSLEADEAHTARPSDIDGRQGELGL
jgi:hypothetical protein